MSLNSMQKDALQTILDNYDGNDGLWATVASTAFPTYMKFSINTTLDALKAKGLIASYQQSLRSTSVALTPDGIQYFDEDDAAAYATMPDVLPRNSEKVLRKILSADNPSLRVREMYADAQDTAELDGIISELEAKRFIETITGDGIPVETLILNPGKTYFERKGKYITAAANANKQNTPMILNNRQVFIVHGRDSAAKNEVARFIEKFGLEPIILNEQIGGGKTIIEKFEKYSDVGYAIILYTPCDMGRLAEEKEPYQPRARQNVVFEHGYFYGRIGRERVAALVKGAIETPSDIAGVDYILMDDSGAWTVRVAKEMKAVGYDIDLNKL